MNILLLGSSGGIGSAIKEKLKGHEITCPTRATYPTYLPEHDFDWLIFAQGFIGEYDMEETLFVNFTAPIFLTQDLLSRIKQGVIYISSTAGIKGNTKYPIYSASKAALNNYAETLARLNPHLSIHALCPGPTDTKMWRSLGLEGNSQPPTQVADVVSDIVGGLHEGKVIITVRNGVVEYV